MNVKAIARPCGAALVAFVGTLAIACGGSAPPAHVATGPGSSGSSASSAEVGGPLQPLAQRQATAQAQAAPALQQAREAAEAAVATRTAAEAVALEQAKADAVLLLGAATSRRQARDIPGAIDLVRQALERWPDYGDAQTFLRELAPEATAQTRAASAQATARARAATPPPGTGGTNPRPAAPTPTLAPRTPPAPSELALISRAIELIAGADTGILRDVAGTLSTGGVTIDFGALPRGVGAVYRPVEHAITIGEQYRTTTAEGMAGLLVHEGTHAYDVARGRFGKTTADCYDLEGRAFANQAKLWEALFGRAGKKNPADSLEREMNNIQQVVNEKPTSFALELLAVYKHQCS